MERDEVSFYEWHGLDDFRTVYAKRLDDGYRVIMIEGVIGRLRLSHTMLFTYVQRSDTLNVVRAVLGSHYYF